MWSRALATSIIRPAGTSTPASCRMRPKRTRLPKRALTGAADEFLEPRAFLAADGLQILLVLDQDAERLVDDRWLELGAVERDEGCHPVERLRDAGLLVKLRRPQLLDERRRLFGEPARRVRHLRGHDPQLFLEVRQVDPEIEAAPFQRVVQLARAVGRENDDRRRRGANRTQLGDRDLVVGEELE